MTLAMPAGPARAHPGGGGVAFHVGQVVAEMVTTGFHEEMFDGAADPPPHSQRQGKQAISFPLS